MAVQTKTKSDAALETVREKTLATLSRILGIFLALVHENHPMKSKSLQQAL
jgi:hypothetical protein